MLIECPSCSNVSLSPQPTPYSKPNQDKNLHTSHLLENVILRTRSEEQVGMEWGGGKTKTGLCYEHRLLVFNPLGHSKELLKGNFASTIKS